jgi:hypothetical protein
MLQSGDVAAMAGGFAPFVVEPLVGCVELEEPEEPFGSGGVTVSSSSSSPFVVPCEPLLLLELPFGGFGGL